MTAPESLGGELVKIADIILKTALVTSKFADETLYFRHRPANHDRKYWPNIWRHNDKIVRFVKNEDTIWGNEVP